MLQNKRRSSGVWLNFLHDYVYVEAFYLDVGSEIKITNPSPMMLFLRCSVLWERCMAVRSDLPHACVEVPFIAQMVFKFHCWYPAQTAPIPITKKSLDLLYHPLFYPVRHFLAICLGFFQEMVMVLWFAVEYILRLWSAGCRFRYQDMAGRIKFARKPLCIVGKTHTATGVIFFPSVCHASMNIVGQTSITNFWNLLPNVNCALSPLVSTTLYLWQALPFN